MKIGIPQIARELTLETTWTADEARSAVAAVMNGEQKILEVPQLRGDKAMIAGEQLAYVVIGAEHARPVGFGTV